MMEPFTKLATSILLALLLSAAPAAVEATRYPITATQRRLGKIARISAVESQQVSARRRSLQTNKVKDDGTVPRTSSPVAKAPLTLAPAKSPTLSPVISPSSFAPVISPSSFAPVIRHGSTWQTGDAADGGDSNSTASWAFEMETNPPVAGNLLLVQLEAYLEGAEVEYESGEFRVTSPADNVVEHKAAVQDVDSLQTHMQQTLGDAFRVVSTQVVILAEDTERDPEGSSIQAGIETEEKYSKKDIMLLIAFGVSMALIIGAITGIFLWKKREIGENEKGSSREWAYDKEKEERLAVAETLSSAANVEGQR